LVEHRLKPRTKAITRKLKEVQTLPAAESQNLLTDMTVDALEPDDSEQENP